MAGPARAREEHRGAAPWDFHKFQSAGADFPNQYSSDSGRVPQNQDPFLEVPLVCFPPQTMSEVLCFTHANELGVHSLLRDSKLFMLEAACTDTFLAERSVLL